MNHMSKIAEILGVKLGEKFTIEEYTGEFTIHKDYGLYRDDFSHGYSSTLLEILKGKLRITLITIPFQPKMHETYYTPNVTSYEKYNYYTWILV